MPGFDPFRYRFPYTNINNINLDWIIKKVKALSEAVASIDISRMDEIAEQAETAQQDAETALATAQSAETTANSVQGIANNALTTAQSAETTANSVQGIANNALSTAQSAQTTATQAASDAQTANNNAIDAISIGNNAIDEVNALNARKADKVSGATLGNFASLAANGNLLDSGHSSADFAPAAAGIPAGGAAGQVLTKTGSADYAAAWQSASGGGDVTADMLGIVIDGNSTPVGAAVGQYVIVKDSTITGITDGLYTAAQAIPANTAIDSTYLTAVSGGGLNGVLSRTQWVLMWENASPIGSDFAAQTINLDLTGMTELKIYAAHYDGMDDNHRGWGEYIQIVPIGVQTSINASVTASNKVSYTNYRYVYASANGVTFGVGIECSSGSGSSQVANSMQPLKIFAR